MRRREFIIAGMAAAWPFAAHPQQQKKYRIGVLVPGGAASASFLNVLREELRKSGYLEGQNLLVEFKSAEGRNERLAALAVQLVALKVDVIVAYQTPSAQAAQQATREVPIVISAGDPGRNRSRRQLGSPRREHYRRVVNDIGDTRQMCRAVPRYAAIGTPYWRTPQWR